MDTGGLLDDRFELFRELGEGTTAHTFLALEHGSFGLRRLSALKLLKPAFRRNKARLERLLGAARLLAGLEDPRVVSLRALGATDGETYLATRYVAGESLLSILASCTQLKRPPPTTLALRMLADTAWGVEAIHQALGAERYPALLHLALRPANVLVGYDGVTCVCDAGLAALPMELLEDAALSSGMAQFIPPEALQDAAPAEDLTAAADVYGLAACLYVLLTLRFPFDEQNVSELFAAKARTAGVAARQRRPSLSEDLELLLLRGLAPDPRDRQPSAGELAAELEFVLGEQDARGSASAVADWLGELYAEQRHDKLAILRHLVFPNQTSAPKARAATRELAPTKDGAETTVAVTRAATLEAPLAEVDQEPDTAVGSHLDASAVATRVESLTGGEGPTAVTALDQVFSDAPTNPRAGFGARSRVEVPPAAERKKTPQPEPAFTGELRTSEPEGDTIRAAKPAERWPANSTQLSTVPFEEDEKTDVGHKPD